MKHLGSLALGLALLGNGCNEADLAKVNRAGYFGWGGYADTSLKFGDFFNGNHTLMCWFMLQHPMAYAGPMLAENGTGTFFVGQRNWRSAGNDIQLMVKIGDVQRVCDVEDAQFNPPQWHHLALVRDIFTMHIYIDGQPYSTLPLSPLPQGIPNAASTLRLGRRTTGQLVDNTESQFYGFLDDVAVFNRALTQSEIQSIISAKRLSGSETGLIAAWNFDKLTPSGDPLPPIFSAKSLTFGSLLPGLAPAGHLIVTPDRKSDVDAKDLPYPFQQKKVLLPFQAEQIWYVGQGNEGIASHNGYAAFAWDFSRPDVPQDQSCGQPLYAAVAGTITLYDDSPDPDATCQRDHTLPAVDEPNKVQLQFASNPDEAISYIHVLTGSATPALGGMTPPFAINLLDPIAQVGSACPNNCHLHLGHPWKDKGITVPMAFSDYWVSDDQGQTWRFVEVGVPQYPQWVRRPASVITTVAAAAVQHQVAASSEMEIKMERAAGSRDKITINRFNLSRDNLVLKFSLPNSLPFLPRVHATASVPRLEIDNAAPLVAPVDRDGNFQLAGPSLRVQGLASMDLGWFGRISESLERLFDPAQLKFSGQIISEDSQVRLELKAQVEAGTLEATFVGNMTPDGTAQLQLSPRGIVLISHFLDGGRADINRDGMVDATDLAEFVAGFTGPKSEALTAKYLRRHARAEASAEIDPSVPRPHPGELPWNVQVLNDGTTLRSNWGNNPGNYDTFNGPNAAESEEWLALLLGPKVFSDEDAPIGSLPPKEMVGFTAFRYWRGPQFFDGGWWAGPVTVEVMTAGHPANEADILDPRNWTAVARSDGSLGAMSLGPFATTPEPNNDPSWDGVLKVHRPTGSPPEGIYDFSNDGDADDERPFRIHYANDGDRQRYLARPDYLHFTFAETRGAGVRIRGPSASGPLGGVGTYISCSELQAWFNPSNAPSAFCRFISNPAHADAFDFDNDGDIDADDYASFLGDYSGSPRLERIKVSDSQIRLSFNALADRTYELQGNDSPDSEGWSTIASFDPAAVPKTIEAAVHVSSRQQFFRLLLKP